MEGVHQARLKAVIKLLSALWSLSNLKTQSMVDITKVRSRSKNTLRIDMEMLLKKKFYMIIIAKQVHRVQRLLQRLDLFYFCSHIVEALFHSRRVARISCEYAQLLFSSSVATMGGRQ